MQHPGSDESVWKNAPRGQRMQALKQATGLVSFKQRMGDVPFVIDQVTAWNKEEGHTLFQQCDMERLGMCGHSYGAVTTLAMAGQGLPLHLNYEEKRFKAYFVMSPQPGKLLDLDKAFGHITKPMLCMTGTKDASPIDKAMQPSDRQKVYAHLPTGDAFQLVLDGAAHHAFGDHDGHIKRKRNPKHHPAIQQISLTFWLAYLQNDEAAKAWLKSQKVIADSDLGEEDQWYHK